MGATEYIVYRKALNETDWGNPIATLPGSATSYSDNNVQVGVGYEYAFFKEDFSYYQETVCVTAGTSLQFTINDSNGIGLCCSFGNGFYEVRNCNNIIVSGDDFGFSESTNFTACNDGSGCTEIDITIKPSMIDNSTSWSLRNTQTNQIIASAGGAGAFLRPRPEYGFIYAGIELPALENRGRILLVVENDLVTPLASEIDELKLDFIKDGWRVNSINVDRNDPVASVRNSIIDQYNANSDLKAVLLLGHVPVAYSGSIFPDTHTENEGAYPADVYYGEMNGNWTDNLVNTTSPFLSIYHNVPGDGRFDQDVPPSGEVELQVGRVDFFDMPIFNQSEVQLMEQYLNKNHQFKTRQINPTRRALVDDNIGQTIGAPAASGWRNFSTMFGASNVSEVDYFGSMSSQSYLWSYGAGSGNANSAAGVGTVQDFSNSNLQNVFTLLFGSQFGNWAFADNLLRAPLASGQTLTSCYSGNPPWVLHHMSMGYHIGYSLQKTQNNTNDLYLPSGPALVSTALMGDPTLRMHMVQAPSNLQVSSNSSSVSLNWNAPNNESVAGYYIYRASNVGGTFQRINNNTITNTNFTDNSPLSGENVYLVKTLKLETSGSGSYYNLSLGVMGNANFSGNGGDTTPPTAILSTTSNIVSSDFSVNINFSENINGLSISDFNITNGNLSNLSGSGANFSIDVSPVNDGQITLLLPAQTVSDNAGNLNTQPSNMLNVSFTSGNTSDCNSPSNLALNKPSTQHSTQFEAEASRANDGSTNGDFWNGNSVSLTNWTNESWWEVDLGAIADIDEIRIFNRTDCCQNIFSNYYVLVSDNPFLSNNLNSTINQNGVLSFLENNQAGSPTTVTVNSTGRYVRIQLAGQGFLAIAETEVLGCFSNGTEPQDQTITFNALPNKLTTDAPFDLNANASSGLPISFSVVSGPANINGNTVTLDGIAGTVIIAADQSGNTQFNAAPTVTQSFLVTEPSIGDCNNPTNIALGKTATQSGTQLNADAGRAVDGNTNGNFWATPTTTLTNWVQNAWWELDLGEVADIETVRLWNRTDCCDNLFGNFYVLVSDVPFNSTDLNSTIDQANVSSQLETGMAGRPSEININRTGRYIRIQLAGTSYLAISEIEVIGCLGGGGCPTAGTPCDDGNSNTINDTEDGNCVCSGTPIGIGCSNPQNVALAKSTNQSSTLSAAGITGSSSKAVDGNTNGTFFTNPPSSSSVTATNNEFQSWWEVDLGSIHSIEEIKVFNRTDGSDRTQNCYVLVSDTPFNSSDLTSARNQAIFEENISGLVGSPSNISLNVEGQYVRVQLEGNGHLVLAEVEVIGCLSNPVNNPINNLNQKPQVVDFQVVKGLDFAEINWNLNQNNQTGIFIIEKSNGGEEFDFFKKITNEIETEGFVLHRLIDNDLHHGENYYRLRLLQKDGSEKLSEIRKIIIEKTIDQIFIFPNPTDRDLFINLKQYIYKNINLQIYDPRGRLMENKNYDNLENDKVVINLNNYQNGWYLLAIQIDGFKTITKKFIVEKGN